MKVTKAKRRNIGYLLSMLMAVGILFTGCTNENTSKIEGHIEGINEELEVSLYRQDFNQTVLLSSAKVKAKKPTFKFKMDKPVEPTFYQLHFSHKIDGEIILLLLTPEDDVNLEINLDDFWNYSVEGSDQSLLAKELTLRIGETIKSLDSLRKVLQKAESDTEKQEANLKAMEVVEVQREFSENFIRENSESRASVMALYQQFAPNTFVFDRPEDLRLFKAVANYQLFHYPESEYTQHLINDLKRLEKVISGHRLQQFIQEVESDLPEIALPNMNGDTVRLSSLRGKVVLLDFWASFNAGSLMENREYVEIYKRFKSRGFEIYQVSLDYDFESWSSAVKSIGMPWINVCEFTETIPQAALLYNVNQIPANYLVNRNFEIVGKNLFGKELERKISEIL